MLGARSPEAWPRADCATMLPRIARGVEQIGVERKRLTVYTVDRNLIGETEFHGPPDRAGTVEVGYSIVPDYRGRGFASEATRTLIEHAFDRSDTYAGSPPSASTTTTPR
jgi:[ribosomal protein S5]-alanine N-acetyltransferase